METSSDSDEVENLPQIKSVEQKTKVESTPVQKSMAEIMGDELPWESSDTSPTDSDGGSDDVEDWFANIGK